MNIVPEGFYQLKADLCSKTTDAVLIEKIHNLTNEDIVRLVKDISSISAPISVVRDVDMFAMKYGIGYSKIYKHKVIAAKHDLSLGLSNYSIIKIRKAFIRYMLANGFDSEKE